MKAKIKAISYYLPKFSLTNEKINQQFPEWNIDKISSKTGIESRQISAPDEFSSDMALKAAEKLFEEYSQDILKERYFLNCIWVYDTNILKICNKTQLIEAMNKYTLCRTNEMGIMNLLFHFKYNLWQKRKKKFL